MAVARTPILGLDVHETAFLAGGAPRVVLTAVVGLVERGRLHADPVTCGLSVVGGRGRNAVEAAVLDAVGGRGRRSFEVVQWRAQTDPRLTAVAERLRRDGLLTGDGRRLRAAERWWPAFALTPSGRRTLRQLRAEAAAEPGTGGAERAVALGGPAAVTDEGLRAVLLPTAGGSGRGAGRESAHPGYGAHPHSGYDGSGGGGCGDGGGGSC